MVKLNFNTTLDNVKDSGRSYSWISVTIESETLEQLRTIAKEANPEARKTYILLMRQILREWMAASGTRGKAGFAKQLGLPGEMLGFVIYQDKQDNSNDLFEVTIREGEAKILTQLPAYDSDATAYTDGILDSVEPMMADDEEI